MHKKDLINSYINIKYVFSIEEACIWKKILYLHYLKNYITNLTLPNSFFLIYISRLTFSHSTNFYIFLKLSDSKKFWFFYFNIKNKF
jgi:hypothetical protein